MLAGAAYGVTRIVGGSSTSDTPAAGTNKGPCPPGQTRVAVLNGTPSPGLAADFAGPLKQKGYKTTPVGNTDSPFSTSVVMYDPQQGKECAGVISQIVDIPKQQPMDNEVRVASEGDPVAVVLGDDKAGWERDQHHRDGNLSQARSTGRTVSERSRSAVLISVVVVSFLLAATAGAIVVTQHLRDQGPVVSSTRIKKRRSGPHYRVCFQLTRDDTVQVAVVDASDSVGPGAGRGRPLTGSDSAPDDTPKAGAHCFDWDGTNAAGQPVPPGVYRTAACRFDRIDRTADLRASIGRSVRRGR